MALRHANPHMIQRQAEAPIPSRYGSFRMIAYAADSGEPMPHVALISDNLDVARPVPVRIHSECMTGDVFGSRRCDCGEQLDAALRMAHQRGGVVVYLRQEGRGIGLINKLKAYNLQDIGLNTAEANTHLGFEVDARQYEAAIYILKDLGIRQIELMTNNPDKVAAFKESDIEVTDRIPLIIAAHDDNRAYLDTKRGLMGHMLGM
jgi:GTP cyclohydrolase II